MSGENKIAERVDAVGNRANGVAAHYEYAPFGEVTAQVRRGGVTAYDFAALNPWRFSSEISDDSLCLVYYNHRHYDPVISRWIGRDILEEDECPMLYGYVRNSPLTNVDKRGASVIAVVEGTAVAVGAFLACAYPQYKTALERFPDSEDKFRHCWVSCRIAKTCGAAIMEIAGLSKEIRDRAVSVYCDNNPTAEICKDGHGDFWDSIEDIKANHVCVGQETYIFGAVGGWVGAALRQSCEDCCRCSIGYNNGIP